MRAPIVVVLFCVAVAGCFADPPSGSSSGSSSGDGESSSSPSTIGSETQAASTDAATVTGTSSTGTGTTFGTTSGSSSTFGPLDTTEQPPECEATCPSGICIADRCARVAFLTRDVFRPGDGPATADDICDTEAVDGVLAGEFRAYLTSLDGPAWERVGIEEGDTTPIVLPDGTFLGDASLFRPGNTGMEPLLEAPNRHANGEVAMLQDTVTACSQAARVNLARVWTGIRFVMGEPAPASCDGWTNTENGVGSTGLYDDAERWADSGPSCMCPGPTGPALAHLYCVELPSGMD